MLPLGGCSDAQVRAWLGRRGLDPHALDEPTPYEAPALANGALYDAAGLGNHLGVLTMWYSNANAALGDCRLDIIKKIWRSRRSAAGPTTSIWTRWSRSLPAAPRASHSRPAMTFTMSPIFMSAFILDPMKPRYSPCPR